MSQILPDLTQIVSQQAEAIEKLKAQIEAMRSQPAARLTIKLSEKGAVMLTGLQRFPVTLYASQWERVAAEMPRIMQFIKDNAGKVARKPD